MKKKILIISFVFCIVLIFAVIFIMNDTGQSHSADSNFAKVKASYQSDILELQNGKYPNLISKNFTTSIENVEAVYNIEMLYNEDFREKTLLENFEEMDTAIDDFFMESIDKSQLEATLLVGDEQIEVPYHEIEQEKDHADNIFIMDSIRGADYRVQIFWGYHYVWFSRKELGTTHPSMEKPKAVYPYVSCIRQAEDTVIHLKDKEVLLSELEKEVLDYLNGDRFPLPVTEGIDFGIGEVRILDMGDWEGVCFKVRRVYNGIPFEYGSSYSAGLYNDPKHNDSPEISYAVSTMPDTMLSFGNTTDFLREAEEITELLSAGEALALLSERIGENSVYEVHGVELVYRVTDIPEEVKEEVSELLTPRWKIATVNQNDNKYTLFYVDVVTGEITERFEYRY